MNPLPPPYVETFPILSAVDGFDHGFVAREPGVDVGTTDRELALEKLEPHYRRALAADGIDFDHVILAEQVHGDGIAVVEAGSEGNLSPIPDVDGLITGQAGVALGIYVADCCPVWLVDPQRRVGGLVHSGRKGSELGIAGRAIEKMQGQFGCLPADLVVVLGPCIRPPAYEVDIAPMIHDSCRAAGIPEEQIHDTGSDTAADLERYYSYRMEKGRTGRMLAYLRWHSSDTNGNDNL